MALGSNDNQYDKFKTPFFEIKIGSASGKNLTKLPSSLIKLVEKIEITDTIAGCNIASQFNIIFKEGSREPFKKAVSESAKSLYKELDSTNATGFLTDLRFIDLGSGASGFSSIIPASVGATIKAPVSAASALVGAGAANPENTIIVADDTVKLKKVKYVFQEKNMVVITWGYLEDQQNVRTIAGNIIAVQSDFPEIGHPSTSINCAGPGSWLDQVAPTKAVYFNSSVLNGADASGPLVTFSDLDIEDTLKKLLPGFEFRISKNLLNKKLDKYHSKILAAGKSPEQFLRTLKKYTNAIYISYYNPITFVPTIAFISRNDYMARVLQPASLLTFKAPGSILKSISVKADFAGLTGAVVKGVDSEGKIVTAVASNGQIAESLFEGKGVIDTSPAAGDPQTAAVEVSATLSSTEASVGMVEASPEADDPISLVDQAQAKAACMNRLVFLEYTCLGYPKLTNGLYYFGGIGNRYSGPYEMVSVTHIIDQNGYQCRGTAKSSLIDGESGVKPSKASEIAPVEVQLFKPTEFSVQSAGSIGSSSSSGSSGANAMDQYLKDLIS